MKRVLLVALVLAVAACGDGGDARPSPKAAKVTAQSLVNKGLAAHKKGDLDEARKLYREALKKDPKNKFALYDLGVLDHASNPQAAERNYRLALATDPNFSAALYNLALLRIDIAPREAIPMLQKVVAAKPADAAAHYNLGRAYKLLGRKAEANAEFAKAHELNPKIPLETA